MSISGPGLYHDDVGFDVRATFRDLVADGATSPAATDALIAEWGDLLDDTHQACAFWLALADTQSRTGRLEERVRDRALALIDSGEDLARFDHDRAMHRRRVKVLTELRARLTGPQRAPVRIRRPFRSTSPVEPGDIFAYDLPSGRTAWFRCLDIQGALDNNAPVVEVLDWVGPGDPPDPPSWPRRRTRRWDGALWLGRRSHNPNPVPHIRFLARGTEIRCAPLPCTMSSWAWLDEEMERLFG